MVGTPFLHIWGRPHPHAVTNPIAFADSLADGHGIPHTDRVTHADGVADSDSFPHPVALANPDTGGAVAPAADVTSRPDRRCHRSVASGRRPC